MDEDISLKIIISYHKKDSLLKDDILTPVNAGRALAISSNNSDLPWLIENCLGDNDGDNISEKNRYYNEMTSIYWAWKNYEKIGNPDYIGHFHYRRHLCFKKSEKSVYEFGDIDDNYLSDKLGYSESTVKHYCSEYDLIVPRKQWRASAYEHYKRNFDISELDLAVSILKDKFPDYSESADQYLKGSGLYFCNIFIMKKQLFMDYCDFIFTILREYESLMDMTGKRMYISEWITGIFIHKQIQDGVKTLELPTAIAQSSITIPVIFAADNNYSIAMGVAITSLLSNKSNSTSYDIRCMVPNDYSEGNRKRISNLCSKYTDCSIQFKNVDGSIFNDVKISTSHISSITFSRLLIADIFKDLDKAIYLDDDVIVCEDLAIFYRYSLDSNYIGGIKAPGYYYPLEWRDEKLNELQIPAMDQYINAGVLLMNLKQIRNDNLIDKFIELSRNNYRSEDQDILNVACYGRIKTLPFRFNAQTKYLFPGSEERYKLDLVVPRDEIEDAIKKPTIIHFANKVKPWQDNSVWMSDMWLDYAYLSTYKDKIWTLPAEKQRRIKDIRIKLKKSLEIVKSNEEIQQIDNKNDNYLVSVIIPCYNTANTINDCLISVLEEMATLPEIEIICIDDGSEDETLKYLIRWSMLWPNIVVLHQENMGSGIARNKGIKIARGEYIAFMDGDDMYPSPTTLENLYHSAKSKNALICGGSFSSLNQGKVSQKYEFPLDGYTFAERKMIKYVDYQFDFGYTRFIYKRDFLIENDIMFPDYLRYQDPPFFIKCMTIAGEFYAIPECTYRYRIMHKSINWTERKVADMLKAMNDIFVWSNTHDLAKLHYYNYLRLKTNMPAIQQYLTMCDPVIVNLYETLLNNINVDFIKKIDKSEISSIDSSLLSSNKIISKLECRLKVVENYIERLKSKKIFHKR